MSVSEGLLHWPLPGMPFSQRKDIACSLKSFTHLLYTSQCPSPLCYLNKFLSLSSALLNFLLQFFHIYSTWLSTYFIHCYSAFYLLFPKTKIFFLLCSVVGAQSVQSIFDVLMLFILHLHSLTPCLTDTSFLGVWPCP